jgi:hypothetical protein
MIKIIIALFLTTYCYADKASFISKKEADKALKFLQSQQYVLHYCAPCENSIPKKEKIKTLKKTPYWL